MIKIFQFKNSFLSEENKRVQAQYSSVGYFDGLDIKTESDKAGSSILSSPAKIQFLDGFYESCDYFSIVGIRKDEIKDTNFWNEKQNPFLFVTCLRLKKRSNELEALVDEIEEAYNAICYYTFDSSDLIICLKTSSYIEGYHIIEKEYVDLAEKYKNNKVQKLFSVLSVEQKILDELPEETESIMEEETLSCILRCVVKNWSQVKNFVDELKKECACEEFGILGSDDMIIVIKNITTKKLFELYGDSKLLTHNNESYKKAFYNIRTEILVNRTECD